MSQATRVRRAIPSAVNTPTEIHVTQITSIKNDDAETILTEFISASEAIANALPGTTVPQDESVSTGLSNVSGSGAVLSQLKRVQRDLRGLPPMAAEPALESNKRTKFEDSASEPQNKKIKFDDEDDEDDEQPEEPKSEEDNHNETAADADTTEASVIEEDKKDKKEKKEKKEKKDKKKKEKKDKKSKSDDA
ncbi:RNA polymerase I, subunit RPA14 [Suhomyces tanzawaensis NRRL Y-17324]|uniref:RNA polymerase I, subunit RPA14 n=1 Tax=Suhomyces tanzawaensis NRRL Y-17324 TaxID=984487 RepID=A0A1E4SPY7_9ASCO|nr:RNA polymerase I, subunit RPA14 [Suhomyces tanzawaensis NRRL Y-17324]ODV81570.1 RNA polymerase I, subunit RPA14 [Suhomyces tanzawaensis NRRL Y-17324]